MPDAPTIRPSDEAGLDDDQLEELAAALLEKRRELEDSIAEFERQIVAKDDCSNLDAADAAALQESRLRARGMADQHLATLREIDAALIRLSNGRFGVSETTGEPIPYERLKVIPWARTD